MASKICKYLSEYMFDKHNYFINDSFIRNALPFYLNYYEVDFPLDEEGNEYSSKARFNDMKYVDLYDILDKLLNKCNADNEEQINRDELDRIIWYCYKSYKI